MDPLETSCMGVEDTWSLMNHSKPLQSVPVQCTILGLTAAAVGCIPTKRFCIAWSIFLRVIKPERVPFSHISAVY